MYVMVTDYFIILDIMSEKKTHIKDFQSVCAFLDNYTYNRNKEPMKNKRIKIYIIIMP